MRLRGAARMVSSFVALAMGTASCGMLSRPSQVPYASPGTLAPALPGGLGVRFFGVSTIQISDGTTDIMTDGFFSRPGLLRLLLDDIGPDNAEIGAALGPVKAGSPAVLLVAHAHHDHALDSAEVARRTGAMLVGSKSVANIGKPESIEVVEHRDMVYCGGFSVEVIESPHTPSPLFNGSITRQVDLPAKLGAFRDGGNFSFLVRHERGTILVHPSTNFLPDRFKDVRADVVFLGIARLGRMDDEFARAYWREVVHATGAKIVIPIHWDDFMVSLRKPLRPMPIWMDDFDASLRRLDELRGQPGPEVRVVFMRPFESYELPRGRDAGMRGDAQPASKCRVERRRIR